MAIRIHKSNTPGTRTKSTSDFKDLTKSKPEKKLLRKLVATGGRNNRGVITTRHRSGGHKKLYRLIDFKRNRYDIPAKVASIEYDPNRNARIALVHYKDGVKRYILHPKSLSVGSEIVSGPNSPIEIGNALPLRSMPLGTLVHNVELTPGSGGKIVKAAGASSQVVAKDGDFVTLKLPSGEVRLINNLCYATIGQVGNAEYANEVSGKAGRHRWLGIRPTVRGVVMNPCDHPHGGGEGRSPIGRARPVTPWGKPALGIKTRKRKKLSDAYILRRSS